MAFACKSVTYLKAVYSHLWIHKSPDKYLCQVDTGNSFTGTQGHCWFQFDNCPCFWTNVSLCIGDNCQQLNILKIL